MRWGAIAFVFLGLSASVVWVEVSAGTPSDQLNVSLIYTAAPAYDAGAWLRGAELFPAGAQVMLREKGISRVLAPGFAASADPAVSFDGKRVLFAGKREAKNSWQIWEVAVGGGEAKRITACDRDCIRPFYLPGSRLVYARRVDEGFVLETAPLEGGTALQLTYAPGNAMPTDVLRDGRVLFEAAYPMGSGASAEVYTVYSDGSGVEAYRCDHGTSRQAGKQAATGDILFASEHGVGRFTSALAHEVDMKVPVGEFGGGVTEISAGNYVVPWRADAKAHYSLESWNLQTNSLEALVAKSDADLVQPVLLGPRRVPNLHPSGLHEWNYANLLCLNAYTSKYSFAAGAIASMRLYTRSENGYAKLLGNSTVEADGSFFVRVPADQPLQIELLDREGKTLQREQGWFWMRRGEQRICVGCHSGPERSPENAVPAVLLKTTTPVDLTGANVGTLKGGR